MKLFATLLLLSLSSLPAMALEEPPVKAVLFPFREATIAARIDSTVESYAFQMGGEFKEGDLLVKLDDRRFIIELKRSKEQYEYAKVVYEDQKKLHDKKFTSDFELKKRELELRSAENTLAEAELNLSYCTILAPFSGRVEEIFTREHEIVRPGQPLLKTIDDLQLLAVMNIAVADLPDYGIGSDVNIELPESGLLAAGKVYEVMPRADHRSGTIQIKALLDNRDGLYKAGMTGILKR